MDSMVVKHGCKFLVTWAEDSEHMRVCVSYKHLATLKAQGFKEIEFYPVNPNVLIESGANVAGIGRGGAGAYAFFPSDPYINQVMAHLQMLAKVPKELSEAYCVAENLSFM